MGKQYSFSTKMTVDVDNERVVITGVVDEHTFEIANLKSVFYTKPVFVFGGYVCIDDTYVFVKKKDIPLAEELLAQLESLGVFVQRKRKVCTENYIEQSIGVYIPTYWLRDGEFYAVDHENKVCKIDVSQIKSIWIDNGVIKFNSVEHNEPRASVVKVYFDDGEEEELFLFFKKKYKNEVIKFANKVSDLGGGIPVNVQ